MLWKICKFSFFESFLFSKCFYCCNRIFLKEIFGKIQLWEFASNHWKFIITLYILLWLTLERRSFSSNVIEEIRLDWRKLQRSLIIINLSKIFFDGIQWKPGLSELKSNLVCGFEKDGLVKKLFCRRWCRDIVIAEI